jgi:hypothetical protein
MPIAPTLKIVEGAFVEVLFPTSERPRQPGLSHICYCLGVRPPLALMAYTTSAPWPAYIPLPFGFEHSPRPKPLHSTSGALFGCISIGRPGFH